MHGPCTGELCYKFVNAKLCIKIFLQSGLFINGFFLLSLYHSILFYLHVFYS